MSETPRSTAYRTPPRSALRHASLGQAWRSFFQHYFEFKGFASRSEFWWVQGPFMVLSGLYALWRERLDEILMGNVLVALPVLLTALFLFIPSLSVHWRRLHDDGLAGPWWFISCVPALGPFALMVLTLLPPRPERQKPEWR